jgi:hypothetical protein
MRNLSILGMLAALFAAAALPAAAQAVPSYATTQASIRGRVSGFDGKYALTVRDAKGYVDRVQLHDGTVINPRGLTLGSGMTVTVYGRAEGDHFVADEIDTPYHRDYAYVAYPYAPYPYYGPYWGPYYRFGLNFRFR